LLASAVLLVVGVPVGGVLAGGAGAAGVAAGVGLVVFSYLVSSLVVAWVDLVARHLLLVVGLLTYVVKFAVFGAAMYSVWQTGWAGLVAMGIAVIVATVVWTGTQLWWILTAKIPYVELDA
jgi:ATP synthase protein I